MKLRHLYLSLCVPGLLLPYAQLLPWLNEHGPDLPRLVAELFSTRIGAFFGIDVLVSALVLLVFIASEGCRLAVRRPWVSVVATLLVGVSLGLPLFLYQRQAKLDAGRP
ncbi:DUF2834 domain-containing protein [Lysobacter antibioticus]|uniref:DUF2834 domain-containing protein n=1 Tax=Lysobacter antibioticus TaxID=84531 RepID=UPI0004CFF168|nr:DUF2834 domain-containing protein [Lysobacter antibioticus]